MFTWLGEGYGQAVRDARNKREVGRLVKRLGNVGVVVRLACPDDDYGSSREWSERYTIKEIAQQIQENRWPREGDLDQVADLSALAEQFRDVVECGGCFLCSFLTTEQDEVAQQERERQRLEELASSLASEHGLRLDTLDFIAVVEREIERERYGHERWNDPEVRMEEWAAHRFCGSTEAYFDDLNYVNGQYDSRIDDLQAILGWMETNCPMLMAQHRERQLTSVGENDEPA